MAERKNALVLKTRGGKTPEGSNPSAPAPSDEKSMLKKIKQIEKSAFKLCKLRGTSLCGKRCRPCKQIV